MQALPAGLVPLTAYEQFIVYKLVPSVRPGKTDKLPIDYRTGTLAPKGSGAAYNWTSATIAIEAANRLGDGYGVGYSFSESDPFWFLDIDNCLETNGQWSALAMHLLNAFPGAYVEVSQSGRGLHIIGRGAAPAHGCKNIAYGLEFYTEGRFVALTGTHAGGDASTPFDYALPWLVENYFKPSMGESNELTAWTTEPVAEWVGPADNEELLRRAMRSKSSASVFGNRASFADLWHADADILAAAYPSEDRVYDASSADAALAQHLAFWTGKNCARIQELMQGSSLRREKWDREDYITRTILNACARQRDVLIDKPSPAEVLTVEYDTEDGELPNTFQPVRSDTLLTPQMQIELFQSCVYVIDLHRVMMKGGMLVRPEQFRVLFGGYNFMIDAGNERTTRNAWEAFSESQAYRAPRAHTVAFQPHLDPGTITKHEGYTRVNSYYPVLTPRRAGDVSPFLNHLARILPDKRDQDILLAYMAACVQHKGIKFQWAPLIQGVEGNGKTLLTRCVAFAIGERHTHFPKASQIAKHFNAWMHGRIFIGVEDVYMPHSQQDILEELKPMITNERIEIERKGVDQVTLEVCGNFILNCNSKSSLRKTRNDRRLAVFYCAQQLKEDLIRDGMDNGYFPRLYTWLTDGYGYEIVNEFLNTYTIPDELNPAHGHIAPMTSSTEEALVYGLGRAEQEILEAVDREEAGFKGGWISSVFVDRLLERINMADRIPPNKRRELLTNLGYDWHPGLSQGRVNNVVLPDGAKPRLFIKRGSELTKIHAPADIAHAYSSAQNNS